MSVENRFRPVTFEETFGRTISSSSTSINYYWGGNTGDVVYYCDNCRSFVTGPHFCTGSNYWPSARPAGWECPRCGKINAPHISCCDCSNTYIWPSTTITINWPPREEPKKDLTDLFDDVKKI